MESGEQIKDKPDEQKEKEVSPPSEEATLVSSPEEEEDASFKLKAILNEEDKDASKEVAKEETDQPSVPAEIQEEKPVDKEAPQVDEGADLVSKEKLIQALNTLMQEPGDAVPQSKVNSALAPFIQQGGKPTQADLTSSDATKRLDELLKKYKVKE